MTEKEFEARVEELKSEYGVPEKFCFKMDANFKLDENAKWESKEQYDRAKTAAAANFFTEAITTSSEDMQILEAAMLDKGNYAYIISTLHGIPSMQILRPVFLNSDGSPMKTPEELNLPDEPEQDKMLNVFRYALKRAAKDAWGDGNSPDILIRSADEGGDYERIVDNDGGEAGKDIFVDFAVQNLNDMSEKDRILAWNINMMYAEDMDVPRERCFVLETSDAKKAREELDRRMNDAGAEFIDCTYNRRDKEKENENNFIYGANGKNCLVHINEGESKLLNAEPYEKLEDALKEIVKSIE